MEYKITFTVPDELDVLIDLSDRRAKYLNDKIQEFIRQLLTQEVTNHVDHNMLDVKPAISRAEG